MKTLITLLTGVALFSFAALSPATATDNIAASPKYRQLLNEQQAAAPATVASHDMNCGACKDQVTTHKDMTARGANKPLVTTTTHLCPGCNTQTKVIGQGKAATTVVNHTCTAGQSAGCCSTGS